MKTGKPCFRPLASEEVDAVLGGWSQLEAARKKAEFMTDHGYGEANGPFSGANWDFINGGADYGFYVNIQDELVSVEIYLGESS